MRTRTELANVKTYTMRELNQSTAQVLDEINDSDQPAIITKHGRFIALITPLRDVRVEELVLTHGTIGQVLDERAAEENPKVLSPAEVAQQIEDRRNR
ncbi:type II toxin-antitoxin system prevent-host-death family antitoxin [Actinosynnema sp. NPDC023658]|uniref:type II toxin-antitoxin system prevent-host-death family antitoxin n=1 Tax=Actinosynnema sp. NPDC023658 TaxID=3155465 RepID=UPI0034009715